jgi:hypothetical protein
MTNPLAEAGGGGDSNLGGGGYVALFDVIFGNQGRNLLKKKKE